MELYFVLQFKSKKRTNIQGLTDDRSAFLVDDAAGKEVEVELFAVDHHCVACVVATLDNKPVLVFWNLH
ncbi:unnamed protein product [Colias eurytheme]|nr:unnamed protein product [Colias eurytheme]